MSLDSCFEREMEILDKQLANGDIDENEYSDAVRELEDDMAHEIWHSDKW